MAKQIARTIRNPYLLFGFILVIVWVLDGLFGDMNFNPDGWLSHTWFAELVACIITAVMVIPMRISLLNKLPWLLSAITLVVLSVTIIWNNPEMYYSPPDRYNNPVSQVYNVIENTLPYTGPFRDPEKDYLLFSEAPEFFKMQVYIVGPFLAGIAVSNATKRIRQA